MANPNNRAMELLSVILIGHPACNRWCGFPCTKEWGISMPNGSTFPGMLLEELLPGALDSVRGPSYPPPSKPHR